jgi:GxxExxY protein
MNTEDLDKLTKRIIGCAYRVSNALGIGFVEKVYENALVHLVRKDGLKVDQQHLLEVVFDGIVVGEFFVDLLVEKRVLVELKAVTELNNDHLAQALNYLRASSLEACLLINFGKTRIQVRHLHPSPNWKSSKP